ncbi:MAG: shikimate kinase [Candidatus Woesearchaeota archaeon]
MRITITGPRSVGKTTTAVLLAEQLKLRYTSWDDLMDELLQPYGGLSKLLKDKRKDIINKHIIPCCEQALKKDGVILDLAGGSLYAQEGVGEKVRKRLKKKSTVIGLLPSINDQTSIEHLYKRERERKHFNHLNDQELKNKVRRNYLDVKAALKKTTDNIIYTAVLTPGQVVAKCRAAIR